VDKTCKLDDHFKVAIFWGGSSVRVRNTWAICREDRDNSEKSELIPDVNLGRHLLGFKAGDRKAWHFAISPRPISLLAG
jgi:hypothetical protein